MVSYLRPLFKIGYEAMRGAGKVAKNRSSWMGGTRDWAKSRPYIGDTRDIAGMSRKAFYSYLGLETLGEMTPGGLEKVQEDTSATIIPPEGGAPGPWNEFNPYNIQSIKKELQNLEEGKNSAINKNNDKDVVITTGEEGNKAATNKATTSAANNPDSETVQNDSVTRVNAYKDVIRQFIGSGEEGERMQKAALLMNIGGMMMAGKSDDPGMQGFVDIIGQTAMQTAPMLFQMGVEKGKAEREIGQAALQLYLSQLDDDKRTGDFVAVWDNVYERDDNKNIVYDPYSGAPKVKGRNLVSQFRANSSEMDWFMDQNNELGYPRYTFQPSSGTGAGLFGISAAGGEGSQVVLRTKASQDTMIKFADYERRALDSMANIILPMMIEGRDSLIGYKGEIGRLFGGPAFLASEMKKAVTTAYGEDAVLETEDGYQVNRSSKLGQFYSQVLGDGPIGTEYNKINADGALNDQGIKGMSYAVLEAPTKDAFIDLPGVGKVPVYVDRAGKYGVKGASYMTRGELEKILFDPRKGTLEIFETTLGLALARNRQPTGRMLADVLRRSFEDAKMTSILGKSNMPQYVIGKYVGIYNELYNNMSQALNLAGVVASEDLITGLNQEVAGAAFTIPNAKNMANQYYTLRQQDPSYSTAGYDIAGVGIASYPDWVAGLDSIVYQDNLENKQQVDDAFETYQEWFNSN